MDELQRVLVRADALEVVSQDRGRFRPAYNRNLLAATRLTIHLSLA